MHKKPLASRVNVVTALDDPTRRSLLEFVARSTEPVSRDTVASQFDLPRSTAAFHLDRLADQGLVDVIFKRLTGRNGPGAGRPAKLYQRTASEINVSIPERHYDVAAKLLATAVENSLSTQIPVSDALATAAHDHGLAWGAGADNLNGLLESGGFEPHQEADGTVVMRNCPFHQLVVDHPETTCTMNLHLLRGAAAACGDDPESLQLNPAPGRCCVTYRPTKRPESSTSQHVSAPIIRDQVTHQHPSS